MTDSDNESDEEGGFGLVYGRTWMTSSGRLVRDHHWCVWIYEAGVIFMVIRLGPNLFLQQKLVNRGLNIVIAYLFLLLRLDNYVLFHIFSYL